MGIFAIRFAALAVVGALLSGCAGSGWSCAGWEKIAPSRKDTSGTKAAILEHNNFGRKQGCW